MPRRCSVLALSYAPDDRASTKSLRDIVRLLNRRPDAQAELWFLMNPQESSLRPWDDARVVDDLRTWEPATRVDALPIPKAGLLMRGQLLRHWLRELSPNVIILDDGVGEQVTRLVPRHVSVVRINPTANAYIAAQPRSRREPDVLMASEDAALDRTDPRYLHSPLIFDHTQAVAASSDTERARTRERLRLPADAPLVGGWGVDGWLDGPDVFPRILWAMGERGVPAHGVWLGPDAEDYEIRHLHAEAARCGVADRYHHRTDPDIRSRVCADVAVLPLRAPADRYDLQCALAAGQRIVTFPEGDIESEWSTTVPTLDIDAAADAAIDALRLPRATEAAAWQRASISEWLDEFIERVLTVEARR